MFSAKEHKIFNYTCQFVYPRGIFCSISSESSHLVWGFVPPKDNVRLGFRYSMHCKHRLYPTLLRQKQPFYAPGANFRNYLHNASSANNLHYYIYVGSWCEVWEHTTGRGADFVYISAFKCEVKEHFSAFLHPLQPLGANFTNIYEAFLVSCNDIGQQKQISFPKSAPRGDSTRVPVRTLGTFSCPSDGFCCKMCFSKLKNGAKKMRSFHYKRDDLRKIHTFRTNFCT